MVFSLSWEHGNVWTVEGPGWASSNNIGRLAHVSQRLFSFFPNMDMSAFSSVHTSQESGTFRPFILLFLDPCHPSTERFCGFPTWSRRPLPLSFFLFPNLPIDGVLVGLLRYFTLDLEREGVVAAAATMRWSINKPHSPSCCKQKSLV
jgi:hypothetical protein